MNMKKVLIGGIALAALGLGGMASAHPGAGQEGGKRCERGAMMKTERTEQHLGNAKEQLQITPAQEAAWQAYEAAVKGQFGQRGQGKQMRQAELSAPERAELRIARMEQRLAGMKQVSEALQELYGTLTPEQRAQADELLAPRHGRHGRHARHQG